MHSTGVILRSVALTKSLSGAHLRQGKTFSFLCPEDVQLFINCRLQHVSFTHSCHVLYYVCRKRRIPLYTCNDGIGRIFFRSSTRLFGKSCMYNLADSRAFPFARPYRKCMPDFSWLLHLRLLKSTVEMTMYKKTQALCFPLQHPLEVTTCCLPMHCVVKVSCLYVFP